MRYCFAVCRCGVPCTWKSGKPGHYEHDFPVMDDLHKVVVIPDTYREVEV